MEWWERWKEEKEKGRAWQTSANSRLVTLKMLWASEPLVIDYVCVCVCACELMGEGETECAQADRLRNLPLNHCTV